MRNVRLSGTAVATIFIFSASSAICQAKVQVGPSQSMAAIDKLVTQGKLSDAIKRLSSGYRFDNPEGLAALRQFSIMVLRRGLLERDPYERCYAASSLGQSGEPDNITILTTAFKSTKLGLKTAAADGLGEIGDDAAIAALQRLYRSGSDGERQIVVEALAGIGNPNAMAALSEAAGNNDKSVRLIAIKGLGRLRNREAIPRLRQLLAVTQDPMEKTTIARSLLLLGDDSGMETIKAALQNPHEVWAMATAALAMGDAHDPQVVPMLKQALTAQDDIDVRLAAAVALTHYNDPAGAEFIKGAIQADDPITIRHIGELLDDIDLTNAREILTAALANPDIGLRMAALKTIGSIGGEPEAVALRDALAKINEPTGRALIARALGRLARPTCIEPLLAMVPESTLVVRYTAAAALERTASRLLKQSGSAQTPSAVSIPGRR